ncbi:MAG: helix-turn-helix domain-containing protein [Bdellovibrionota bacterium]
MAKNNVVETLKKVLKVKKITYKMLADELAMSESGVKKLLTSKDISLTRVEQITRLIGLSLADLFQIADEAEVKNVRLSPKQENALFENNLLFRVYWLLAVEEKTLDAIKKSEKLTNDQLQRNLLKLENLDLIKIGKNQRIASVHKGLFRWASDGPLVKKLNHEWSENTLKKVLNQKNSADHLHRLSYLRLSEKSKSAFYERLNELVNEFARLSQREKTRYADRDLTSISSLIAIANSGFI